MRNAIAQSLLAALRLTARSLPQRRNGKPPSRKAMAGACAWGGKGAGYIAVGWRGAGAATAR